MKKIISLLAASAFALGLAACTTNSATPTGPIAPTGPYATPQPVNPTTQAGAFTQFERLSRPAVKELFERFVDHQISNSVQPFADPTLSSSISSFTSAFRAPAYGAALASVLIPDELSIDLSQPGPAAYLGVETGGATGGKFGGRALTDNVIDISLGAVFGNTLNALGVVATDDKQENNCLISQNLKQNPNQVQAGFPYVGAPH